MLFLGSKCGRVAVYSSKTMELLKLISPPMKFAVKPSEQQAVIYWIDNLLYATHQGKVKVTQPKSTAKRTESTAVEGEQGGKSAKLKTMHRSYIEELVNAQNTVRGVKSMNVMTCTTAAGSRVILLVCLYEDNTVVVYDIGAVNHEVYSVWRSDVEETPFLPSMERVIQHWNDQIAEHGAGSLTPHLFDRQQQEPQPVVSLIHCHALNDPVAEVPPNSLVVGIWRKSTVAPTESGIREHSVGLDLIEFLPTSAGAAHKFRVEVIGQGIHFGGNGLNMYEAMDLNQHSLVATHIEAELIVPLNCHIIRHDVSQFSVWIVASGSNAPLMETSWTEPGRMRSSTFVQEEVCLLAGTFHVGQWGKYTYSYRNELPTTPKRGKASPAAPKLSAAETSRRIHILPVGMVTRLPVGSMVSNTAASFHKLFCTVFSEGYLHILDLRQCMMFSDRIGPLDLHGQRKGIKVLTTALHEYDINKVAWEPSLLVVQQLQDQGSPTNAQVAVVFLYRKQYSSLLRFNVMESSLDS